MNKKTLAWLILILLSLVWGSSFILMKQGLKAFSSSEVAGLRITIASLSMLPLLIKYYKIDLKKHLKGLLLMGVFGNLIPAFLFTKAETQISSGLTGTLNALTTVFTLLIGVLFFKQVITKNQIMGVLIGFAGAVSLVVFANDTGETSKNAIYALMIAVASICYAISVNGIKAFLGNVNSIQAAAWSFTLIGPVAAIYLFGFTDVVEHARTHPYAMNALFYISILAIVGSAASVVLYNILIKMSGAVFASSCTYLIPVVAIGWGILDDEKINGMQVIAIMVIIAGVWLINAKRKAVAKPV